MDVSVDTAEIDREVFTGKNNSIIGATVTFTVDRPLGSYHPEYKDMYYPINYGYIEGVMAPDGEEQDAYILGVNEPVCKFTGKIIAIVYTFTGDFSKSKYYDAWKADVLSDWIRGVYDIKCTPLVMDFETFAFKAFNNTLPKINYVINLNNGSVDLSSLGLLPSICSYLNIPCIPNNSEILTIGENKFVSNCLAQNAGLSIPKYIDNDSDTGIIRPIGYGSSKGIHRGNVKNNIRDLCQEFIPGFDMTISFMYNPIKERLCFVSSLMYLPNSLDINWYLGEKEKEE